MQFEIGPLSEASIGNGGMNPATTAWTDYVMTPAGGVVWMAGEDGLDRFVIRKLEGRSDRLTCERRFEWRSTRPARRPMSRRCGCHGIAMDDHWYGNTTNHVQNGCAPCAPIVKSTCMSNSFAVTSWSPYRVLRYWLRTWLNSLGQYVNTADNP